MSNESRQSDDVRAEPPVEPQLEDLVSYLDGELENDAAETVEYQLVNDPVLRSDADILSRTWALLDSLDEVSGNRQFTQSTLQVVQEETKGQPVPRKVQSYRLLKALARYHVLPMFLMGLVFGSIGILVAQQRTPSSDRRGEAVAVQQIVLKNLGMLQNLELYQRVPDAQILKQLQLAKKGEENSADQPQSGIDTSNSSTSGSNTSNSNTSGSNTSAGSDASNGESDQ